MQPQVVLFGIDLFGHNDKKYIWGSCNQAKNHTKQVIVVKESCRLSQQKYYDTQRKKEMHSGEKFDC